MSRSLLWLREWGKTIAAALLLLCALLFFWAASDFAMPTVELALAQQEDEFILPRGTTAARGETHLAAGQSLDPGPFTWVVRRYPDGFRVYALERFLFLWRESDTLRPSLRGLPLTGPLSATPVAMAHYYGSDRSGGLGLGELCSDMLLLAVTTDPAVARVEATMGWKHPSEGDSLFTADMSETAPDSGVWTLQGVTRPNGTLFCACRAYDGRGELLYTWSSGT